MKGARVVSGSVFFIIGVSGSGKTTVGRLLAEKLALPFHDADDYHPGANVQKMKAGVPLDDSDRKPWLEALHDLAQGLVSESGGVIACSALKDAYRRILSEGIAHRCKWILLEGDYDLIRARIESRSGHYMPASLLESQFNTLETPADAIRISVDATPEGIVDEILLRMKEQRIGIVGMGVMGRSLALNFAEKGHLLSLYNRHVPGKEEGVAKAWIEMHDVLKPAQGFDDIKAFVSSLPAPRTIILMVEAGQAVDVVLESLITHLDSGDVIVDCGNTFYEDTRRRAKELESAGIQYLGAGVSGGEQGALYGPAIMAGGSRDAYDRVGSGLEAIAARDKNGRPCCGYLGPDGAGHYVKMVHNGIEYAEMQLIAEMYGLLRHGYAMDPDAIAEVFAGWQTELHAGYLMEITIDILRRKEDKGWLLDRISDVARSKGTGAWTVQAADALGFPCPVIAAALHARYASAHKMHFQQAGSKTQDAHVPDAALLSSAFYTARIVNHHLGFELLREASRANGWSLDLQEVARIWTNGCIIRSALMERCQSMLPDPLLANDQLHREVLSRRETLSYCITLGAHLHIAMPCHSAALQHLNTIFGAHPTANLIQAQRDYFGAHGYERIDDLSGKKYHTGWNENEN